MENGSRHPRFDPAEQYILAALRQDKSRSKSSILLQELPAIVVGSLFFGWGLWKDEPVFTVIGFGCLVLRLLQQAIFSAKFHPVFLSIFEKYEAALQQSRDEPIPTERESQSTRP